MFFKDQGHIQF